VDRRKTSDIACGVPIFHPYLRASSGHPPEIVALDVREGIVPEGWPRHLSVSTLQTRMEFYHPTAIYAIVTLGIAAAPVLTFASWKSRRVKSHRR
jgi:hypothetical protein